MDGEASTGTQYSTGVLRCDTWPDLRLGSEFGRSGQAAPDQLPDFEGLLPVVVVVVAAVHLLNDPDVFALVAGPSQCATIQSHKPRSPHLECAAI